MYLKDAPPPDIKSNVHDLLLDGRPHHGPLNMHGYMGSEWATCPLTRRSVGGRLLMLARGTVGYKMGLHPKVAMSSLEAEVMQAVVFGQIVLY